MHTVTSTALLLGLKEDDRTVWAGFSDRYRPLIVHTFRRLGLGAADAEDVAQDALLAFATAYRDGKYDADKGRLRSWLFGIAHRALRNWNRRRRSKEVQVADSDDGSGFFARVEDAGNLERIWEEEWVSAVVRQCLEEVRGEVEEKTFEAFRLFVSEGHTARDVGARLGISENAVFGAKRRILRRIREVRPALEEIW